MHKNRKTKRPALHIGDALKRGRQAEGKNQQELADLAGVDRDTVSRWESGRYDLLSIPWVTAERIADLYGKASDPLFAALKKLVR